MASPLENINPTTQQIADMDTAVHDALMALANLPGPSHDLAVTNKILAIGLAAIHDRLGQTWRWEKAGTSR